jgi:hypothetical protein
MRATDAICPSLALEMYVAQNNGKGTFGIPGFHWLLAKKITTSMANFLFFIFYFFYNLSGFFFFCLIIIFIKILDKNNTAKKIFKK